jgi:hypothetical protein
MAKACLLHLVFLARLSFLLSLVIVLSSTKNRLCTELLFLQIDNGTDPNIARVKWKLWLLLFYNALRVVAYSGVILIIWPGSILGSGLKRWDRSGEVLETFLILSIGISCAIPIITSWLKHDRLSTLF